MCLRAVLRDADMHGFLSEWKLNYVQRYKNLQQSHPSNSIAQPPRALDFASFITIEWCINNGRYFNISRFNWAHIQNKNKKYELFWLKWKKSRCCESFVPLRIKAYIVSVSRWCLLLLSCLWIFLLLDWPSNWMYEYANSLNIHNFLHAFKLSEQWNHLTFCLLFFFLSEFPSIKRKIETNLLTKGNLPLNV